MTQSVKNHTRLNARDFLIRVELENLIHVLRKIQDHGNIAALTRQACAGSTSKNGSAILPASSHGGDDILIIAWNYEPDGDLAVIGSIGCVERATTAIEPHLAPHHTSQFIF
jgi:hypothetical protein